MANPKENRTPTIEVLVEQFLRKGYRCHEVQEEDATLLILTHEKKTDTESERPWLKEIVPTATLRLPN